MAERDEEYLASIAENVREQARIIATRLRRVADDIERAADNKDIYGIPSEVANVLAWGVANANTDGPARWLNEYHKAVEAIKKIEAEEWK